MNNKFRDAVVENVFFSKEAAEYLEISVQRLHQLVRSGQLVPLKQSGSGMLFLREDLNERKRDAKSIGANLPANTNYDPMIIDSEIKQEALNYFTVQSFYNGSAKTTVPIFEELKNEIDLTLPIITYGKQIAKRLDLTVEELEASYNEVKKGFSLLRNTDIILKKGEEGYPKRLAATDNAPPFLFARGNIDLLNEKIVAVVGTRNPSPEGAKKAYRLSQLLGKNNIVVSSGLARGIDTQAHTAAVTENNGMTISVIGTSLAQAYPKENSALQEIISKKGLLLSQFAPSEKVQRWFFPTRNAVMSGISLATVVIEAGETSGALKQADYALKQNRHVFIPQSAVDNPNIKWPRVYIEKRGAYKFSKISDLLQNLENVEILKQDIKYGTLFDEESLGSSYAKKHIQSR